MNVLKELFPAFLSYYCVSRMKLQMFWHSLFFWVHGEWIGARNKQIAWSDDLFVPRSDSFPMNPEKKPLIPYIYNVSNKDPSQNSPINVINWKFQQQRVLKIILCINHCACDLPNCRNYFMTLIIGNWIKKKLAGFNEGNMISL